VLLVLCGSLDGSVDLVVHNSRTNIFRFNIDLIDEYSVILEPHFWSIENPSGARIDSNIATRAWWWKAFSFALDKDPMYQEEVKYLFREIYAWFGHRELIVGNTPDFENRFGKIAQLEVATRHLPTLPTSLRVNNPFPESLLKSAIAKPLTSTMDAGGRVRQTTDVSGMDLDPAYPWLIQELAHAKSDITVLVVGSRLYAYRRSRANLTGLDWRPEQFTSPEKWELTAVPEQYEVGIFNFMEDTKSDWGRIDFLEMPDEKWIFLEYNANGQWGFLEQDCPIGLPEHVAEFLCLGPTKGFNNTRSPNKA